MIDRDFSCPFYIWLCNVCAMYLLLMRIHNCVVLWPRTTSPVAVHTSCTRQHTMTDSINRRGVSDENRKSTDWENTVTSAGNRTPRFTAFRALVVTLSRQRYLATCARLKRSLNSVPVRRSISATRTVRPRTAERIKFLIRQIFFPRARPRRRGTDET